MWYWQRQEFRNIHLQWLEHDNYNTLKKKWAIFSLYLHKGYYILPAIIGTFRSILGGQNWNSANYLPFRLVKMMKIMTDMSF